VQRQEQQRQQREQVQMRQQQERRQVREQERVREGLLFYRKRPMQQPAQQPKRVIFS
jgi:hypothetical protein